MQFAATAGLILDPWQELILEVMLGERADGRWAAREVGYLVARQNGKGGVLDALGLAALFLFDDEVEILHSAHEFKTAKKAYRSLKSLIQGAPHLLAQVERRGNRVVGFRNSNEDTSITLQSGAVMRFMARSNNTGRGFSSQRLIVDEAQECSEETRQALLYIVSAQKNPQMVFCGTVPGPKNNGEVWESLRDRGREGGDPGLAWLEWTPEPDVDPRSDEAAIASNPGMPYRITAETIAAERNSARTEEAFAGFCRERLSIWEDHGTVSVIDMESWLDRTGQEQVRPSPVALAVTMSPDRKWCQVGLAGRRQDGALHVQIVQSGKGSQWVPGRVAELVAEHSPVSTVIDPSGPEGSLIADIEALGVTLTKPSNRDHAQAVGKFVDLVAQGGVWHPAQPVLTVALNGARKKKTGQGEAFVLGDDGQTDVSPAKAVVLAILGLSQQPKKRQRSGKVW